MTEDRIGQLVDVAKSAYDIVVLDTPPHFDATTLAALDRSDRLVLVDDDGHPDGQERQARAADAQPPAVPARAHRARASTGRSPRADLRESDISRTLDMPITTVIPRRQGDRRRPSTAASRSPCRPRARPPRRPCGSSPSCCCRRPPAAPRPPAPRPRPQKRAAASRAEGVRRPPELFEGGHVQVLQVEGQEGGVN